MMLFVRAPVKQTCGPEAEGETKMILSSETANQRVLLNWLHHSLRYLRGPIVPDPVMLSAPTNISKYLTEYYGISQGLPTVLTTSEELRQLGMRQSMEQGGPSFFFVPLDH